MKPEVEAKPERYQQQQLSFVKRVTSFKSSEEKGDAKRESLDSLSRREPSRSEDKTDLKHKKPRLLLSSLSSASTPSSSQSQASSQSARGVHQRSSSKIERYTEKKRPTPPSQSKYFASSSSSQKSLQHSTSSKMPHKTISMRQFVDSVEEKNKSSLDLTLDEYLALDKVKRSRQEQELRGGDDSASNRTDKLSTGSSSSNATTNSKWERDRNKFRAKTQTKSSSGISSKWRIDSQSMGRWLTSGKPKESEAAVQSPPRGRGASSPADRSQSGRTSLLERPRVKFSGLRNGSASASASASASSTFRHQSPITKKDLDFMITPSPPEKRRNFQIRDDDDDSDSDDEQRTAAARKRKRSSDFGSPAKRSTTPHKVLFFGFCCQVLMENGSLVLNCCWCVRLLLACGIVALRSQERPQGRPHARPHEHVDLQEERLIETDGYLELLAVEQCGVA